MSAPEFPDLLRRQTALIRKVAHAYGRTAADRDEIAQEIAIQLWRAHARYDPSFAESTFVYRIALNVAISFHRRELRHRRNRAAVDAHALAADSSDPAPNADAQRLLACIDELSALDKALVLLWLDGNEHRAIAEVLGLSASNVGTKLQRLKQRLRAAYDRAARRHDPDPDATQTRAEPPRGTI